MCTVGRAGVAGCRGEIRQFICAGWKFGPGRSTRHGCCEYIRLLCTGRRDRESTYDGRVDNSNNAVLPLRRDNERYAVAVTPSATINTACLNDDEQAEACTAIFLLCIVVVDVMLYVCLTWSAMEAWPGLAAWIALPTSFHIETSHTISSTRSRRQQKTRASRARPIARRRKSGE